MHLILMRHGNTFEKRQVPVQVGARTDLPLTEYGIDQSKKVLQYLVRHSIQPKAIYSGKLKRQTQSARVIANHFDLPVKSAPALNEIDYGLWEGLSAEKIQEKWPEEFQKWAVESIWPEHIFKTSFDDLKKQLTSWFDYLEKTYDSKDVVFAVTSNGLLRMIHNEKVKTGHFCQIEIVNHSKMIHSWNQAH